MSRVITTLVVLLVIGITVGLLLWWRRRTYIKSLTDRGWRFVDSPQLADVAGLNLPPFGVGDDRKVDDLVLGASSTGTPFRAFTYSSTGSSTRGYVVTMPLPQSFPALFVSTPQVARPGVRGLRIQDQPLLVVADDPEFAREAMAVLNGPLLAFGRGAAVDVSIDHDQLVAVGAAKQADQLAVFVEALAPVAAALGAPQLQRYVGTPPPPEASVYGHDTWVYRAEDPGALARVAHTSGGNNHRARNVMMDDDAVLPFVALLHTWDTTRTETYTDSQGNTQTRTVTDHHREAILEFQPRFPFRPFKVNKGLMGDRVKFEWDDFNHAFTVRSADAKFAYDVFHPRTLEFLMAARPAPFEMDETGRLHMDVANHTPETIEAVRAFYTDFFSRVPNFVWEGLGTSRPPLPLPPPDARATAPQVR